MTGPAGPAGLVAREFLARPADAVAPELLGCVLEHDTADGLIAVEVTEVEAYMGAADPASHSYRGRTPRNAVMFGPPGHAYVYFTYGMHFCVNVVCQSPGTASAVLLRAGRIVTGESGARRGRTLRRPETGREDTAAAIPFRDLARGPGRLCQALGITRDQDGADLCRPDSPLRLRPPDDDFGPDGPPPTISAGPRVGVSAAADIPWRFWLTGDPTVSVYRRAPGRIRQ